eukprot:6473991-Amphidinium_carterae.1
MEKKQTEIKVGCSRLEEWEVDECTITHWPSGDAAKPKQWTAYVGAIRRGSPQTLKIYIMECRKTKERAPGPGPIRKKEWGEIAQLALQPLERPIERVSHQGHGKVIHQKKKVNGKGVKPFFTKRVKLTIEKKKRVFWAGTQAIDGLWQQLCEQCKDRRSGKPKHVDGFIRIAQFKHWCSGKDAMCELGRSITEISVVRIGPPETPPKIEQPIK